MIKYMQIYMIIIQIVFLSVFLLGRINYQFAKLFEAGFDLNLPTEIWMRIAIYLGDNGGKVWSIVPLVLITLLLIFRKMLIQSEKAMKILTISNAVLMTVFISVMLTVYSHFAQIGIGIYEPHRWPYLP